MRGLLFALCVVLSGFSYGVSIQLGTAEAVNAPFCANRLDAIAIAKADVEQGIEVASKMYMDAAECGTASVMMKPLRVIYTGTTARNSVIRVIEVEIEINGYKRNFFMLTEDVEGRGLQKT